ncbi:pyruvate kinase [Patescibacteria group bacterium]|nr:MAG: pyruvate kinase [Patescibacteria group bacterium]
MTKRTHIVCTVGPSSARPEMLEKMMHAGMDMARLNFSHATQKDHARLIRSIRAASRKAKKRVPIIQDLQGPKVRLGKLPNAGVELPQGGTIILTTATDTYSVGKLPITSTLLHKEVKKGDRVLIDDGMLELIVTRVVGRDILTNILNGGNVTSHKGMNFPDSTLRVPVLTAKDKADAEFGIAKGVEWIALSSVTNPAPVRALRRLIKKNTPKGKPMAQVMVKIETRSAIDRFDEILKVADGIIIARGDLGVEINVEEVPIRQKELIHACRQADKPVIVATQMLDSMIRNPRPTRAEVSDVANAVFDCASAVMLSGESANGKYPLQAVKMMTKIVKEAETSCYDDQCETIASKTWC